MVSTREAASVQERRIANKLDLKQQSGSGQGRFNKGDLIEPNLLTVECKTCLTKKDSFSIKKKWLEVVDSEKLGNRTPYTVLAFNFNYKDSKDYYVIDDKLMKYLLDKLRTEEL